jgi:hypothetical protein
MKCPMDSCPRWRDGVCEAGDPLLTDGAAQKPAGPSRNSLVLASLEVGRLLADSNRQVFRAQGTCMYPDVRPGDILRIGSRPASEVRVGDIAVCRRPHLLFGHRVIGKGVQDGRAFVLTRPDRARSGDDGPTFDEDLLGVVTAIERAGRRLSPEEIKYSRPASTSLSFRLAFIDFRIRARYQGLKWLGRVQENPIYRMIARPLIRLFRGRPAFSVQLPMKSVGDSLFQSIPLDAFDFRPDGDAGRLSNRWTLAVTFRGDRRAAALARFERCPVESAAPHWRLVELLVRTRYRGAAIEKQLVERARLARKGRATIHTP